MSLVAGVYMVQEGASPPDALCAHLEAEISRERNDQRLVFRAPGVFILKVDLGVFSERAWVADSRGCAALTGEALLARSPEDAHRGRSADLQRIRDSVEAGSVEPLTEATGVFSFVSYESSLGTLTLATDRLGVRPIYLYVDAEKVVFASALRMLDSMPAIRRSLNARTIAETTAFGFPLANRTPYTEVERLGAGEMVRIARNGLARERYWRWDRVPVSDEPVSEIQRRAHAAFVGAVRRRLGSDTATISFLSGGLDSRCVVGTLRDLGARVHTFNFSPPGTQDEIFGRQFAERVGTIHRQSMRLTEDKGWSMVIARECVPLRETQLADVERSALVWSGDGGGILNGAPLTDSLIETIRTLGAEQGVESFLNEKGATISPRVLKGEVREKLKFVPAMGLLQELHRLEEADAARAFYLVHRLLNRERRRLTMHFEELDRHRMEHQLPFYDSLFVREVLRSPLDHLPRHRFYLGWLECFPQVMREVPWQAYPGAVPCPIPVPERIEDQWRSTELDAMAFERRRRLVGRARSVLARNTFPRDLVDVRVVRLATLVQRLRLRDVSHLLQNALLYAETWERCNAGWQIDLN